MSKHVEFNQSQDIQDFVRREVIYCVSSLVSTLCSTAAESGKLSDGTYYDDLLNVCVQDDWETPVEEYLRSSERADLEIWAEIYGHAEVIDQHGEQKSNDVLVSSIMDGLKHSNQFQEFAESHNIDPYTNEAYEYWIVTDWFAKKLEEKGEMVAYDICGLTIWGRATTGQAIYMDSVIQEIYNDLHSEK